MAVALRLRAPDTLVDFHTGEHHNVQTTRAYDCDCENPNPTVAAIVGGAWEWMSGFRGWCAGDQGSFSRHWELIYGDEETPEGAAHSYATYILGISMGILTNIVLELVLVCRVHLLGGVPGGPSPRTLKVLRYAVWCQLVPLAVFIPVNYWAQYDLAKRFLRSHDQGNAYGEAIYASASVIAVVGCVHVAVSLCAPLLRVPAAPSARRPARCRRPGDARADAARAHRNGRRRRLDAGVLHQPPRRDRAPLDFLRARLDHQRPALAILVLTDREGDARPLRATRPGLRVGVRARRPPGLGRPAARCCPEGSSSIRVRAFFRDL